MTHQLPPDFQGEEDYWTQHERDELATRIQITAQEYGLVAEVTTWPDGRVTVEAKPARDWRPEPQHEAFGGR